MSFRQIQVLSRATSALLILQFLIGMFANLFVTFSSSTDPNPLAAIFAGGSPGLVLHAVIGIVLFILTLIVLVSTTFVHHRPLVIIASATFASTALAFISGIAFVYSGYANNALSYLMAAGWLFALILAGTLAGRGEQLLGGERSKGRETGPSNLPRSSWRPLGLTVLQLIAGGIVVFGGLALIGFNPGTINMALGAITLVLGLSCFLSGYAIWTSKTWSVTIARVVNTAIVVFSTGQESYTIATATTSSTVAGSLVGAAIALGLCIGVVLNLPGKTPTSTRQPLTQTMS
jgi:hypothetical protein